MLRGRPWSFNYADYLKTFLTALAPHPYSPHHGGISHHSLTKRLTLSQIKQRGRLQSDLSETQYDKQARLPKEGKMPAASFRFELLVGENLCKNLAGAMWPPALSTLDLEKLRKRPCLRRPAAASSM